MKRPIIIISGATATGKTRTSLKLAQQYSKIEIVNFDSLLFYKELDIGTAKPTTQEITQAPHHLIDVISIHEEMNASLFSSQAAQIVEEIHSRGNTPLLVGGSAFYIRALIKGMYKTPDLSTSSRQEVEDLLNEKGIQFIREELKSVDPLSFNNIHENDVYRSCRALEYYKSTGQKLSDQKSSFDQNDPYDFSKNSHPEWEILHLYLDIPKDDHWNIMKNRASEMIQNGLLDEVQSILKSIDGDLPKALLSIGYKESIEYLRSQGSPSPMSDVELLEKIFISTRRLAKSQKTFFKKITPKEIFHPLDQEEEILYKTAEFLSRF